MAGVSEKGDLFELTFVVQSIATPRIYKIKTFISPYHSLEDYIQLFLVEYPEYEPIKGNIKYLDKEPIISLN